MAYDDEHYEDFLLTEKYFPINREYTEKPLLCQDV